MNQTLDSLVRDLLTDIAPDVDFAQLDADDDVRDAADIDSVDFLNFVAAVHAETGVDIPERDYPQVRTINGCLRYLEARLGP
jgi:acyl carrier protein